MRWGVLLHNMSEKLKKPIRKIFSEPLLSYIKGIIAHTKIKSLGFTYIQVMGIRSIHFFEHS